MEPTYVSSCREITGPGHYVLTANLVSTSGPCLTIHDDASSNGIWVDGQNLFGVSAPVNIPAIDIQRVAGPRITGLVMAAGQSIRVDASSNVHMAGNTLFNVSIQNSSFLVVSDNRIDGYLQILGAQGSLAHNIVVANNRFYMQNHTTPGQLVVSNIGFSLGQNHFDNNTFYGDGSIDDQVIFTNAAGYSFNDNTLSGPAGGTAVWDKQVEFVGFQRYFEVKRNHFTQSAKGPIAGYWDLSMMSGEIADNIADAGFMNFNYAHSGTDPATTVVQFVNMNIHGNHIPGGFIALFDKDYGVSPAATLPNSYVANNRLANNNFGTDPGLFYMVPLGGFINDGGNSLSW